jgi:cupin-like protein
MSHRLNTRSVRTTEIPAVDAERWADIGEGARTAQIPVVIRSVLPQQAATWTPMRFSEQWPAQTITVTVDLPTHGVPYRESSAAHQRTTTVADFVTMLERGDRCYLNQTPLATFPELERELDLKALRLSRIFAVNLWVGGRTRSGLHYDRADNLFLQMFGNKRAWLVSPRCSRFLYPFPDNPSKSQIDPERPDFERYPKIARCRVWVCELTPGDALYIPRGWWHFIAADDISISVNCWHGDSLSELERARMFLAGGARVLWQTGYDFVRYGLLGHSYETRMFSPPPAGLEAYRALRARLR